MRFQQRSLFDEGQDMGTGFENSEPCRPMEEEDAQQGQEHGQAQTQGECEACTGRQLIELLNKQEKRCALSGVELTPDTLSIDHIVAVSDGGGDEIENIQIVHSVVNAMKGTMSNYEFKRWCARVSQWGS